MLISKNVIVEMGASLGTNASIREYSRIGKYACVEPFTMIGVKQNIPPYARVFPKKKIEDGYEIEFPHSGHEFILQGEKCREVKR